MNICPPEGHQMNAGKVTEIVLEQFLNSLRSQIIYASIATASTLKTS